MNRGDDAVTYPLLGSVQNSVGMGFLGNQAVFAVANGLGARVIHAQSAFAGAHGGFAARASVHADPIQMRREMTFLISQRPGLLIVGYLPKPAHVSVVADALREYKGIVLLDPVIGDYQKGLYVGQETARAIRDQLLPLAQVVTPNRFEAEVLIGERGLSDHAYLNALFDMGPEAVAITSFERDPEKHRITSLFSNGYSYHRIHGPYFPVHQAHGAGDVFAASIGTFMLLGASPFASTLLATALCARAVSNSTTYGGQSVDPVATLAKWNPLGHHIEDERAMRFCERSNVENETIRATAADGPRLKFAPPKHQIIYG